MTNFPRIDLGQVLIFPARMLWKIFSRVAGALMLPLSALVWCLRLMRHYRVLHQADIVVLMVRPSGFGHSIQGPDATRRLYPGRNCVFIAPYWNFAHDPEFNPLAAQLWSDINVLLLPRFAWAVQRNHRVISLPFQRWHDWAITWATKLLTQLVCKRGVKFTGLMEIYREALEAALGAPAEGSLSALKEGSPEGRKAWESYAHEIGYMLLLKKTGEENPGDFPRIRLPQIVRSDIESRSIEAWRQAGEKGVPKRCCLYLRAEKRQSYTTQLRNSSTVEAHLDAVRLLNEAGYQVFLTGDREMGQETRREFEGRLMDAESLKLERNIYSLFAGTRADIFIGNNGGGLAPALVNAIPCLFIDWFPYYIGYPNAWFYFKSAFTKTGDPVAADDLISRHVYDLGCSFGVLGNNSPAEIAAAVAAFLDDLENPKRVDPYAHIAGMFPEDTPFRLSGARVSPAWARRYFPEVTGLAASHSI